MGMFSGLIAKCQRGMQSGAGQTPRVTPQAGAPPCFQTIGPKTQLYRFASEAELRMGLSAMDRPGKEWTQTVVLVLPTELRGDLRELIRRRHPGHRLILVTAALQLAGHFSAGDLAMRSNALGWQAIFHERLENFSGLIGCGSASDEETIVFWPADRETPALCR